MKMRRQTTKPKRCENCKNKFSRKRYKSGRLEDLSDWIKRRFCSQTCAKKFLTKNKHPNWKGGIKHRPDGYIRDSATDKYIHRKVIEKNLGRKLKKWEHVHHKNGDKSDNNFGNLQIMTNSSHRMLEVKKQKRGNDGKFTK